MAAFTSSVTASLSANGTTATNGTMTWTAPTLPEGTGSWKSIVLTGSYSWGGKGNVKVTINGQTVTADTQFTITLNNNVVSPLTISCIGGNKNATGNNFTWNNLIITYTSYDFFYVTYNLTRALSSNMTTNILEGSSYLTTITPDGDYTLSSISVVMGGSDITSSSNSNGVITISNVTGDIEISATAGPLTQVPILELKINGEWKRVASVYKKINGNWTEQTDLDSLFDTDTKYVRG